MTKYQLVTIIVTSEKKRRPFIGIASRFAIAVHLLTLLESVGEDAPLAVAPTSEWIAGSVGVNPVIIRSVTGMLRKAGIVRTQQGVAGVTVARPLASITLLEVYHAVEPRAELFSIHSRPNPHCPVGARIRSTLERHFGAAQAALEAELRRTTLQQVVDDLRQRSTGIPRESRSR